MVNKKQHITAAGVLPPPTYTTPSGSPTLAAWADPFTPTFTSGPVSGAPSLGPILPQGQPGDLVPLGGSFSSSATFETFTQTTSGNPLRTAATARRRIANRGILSLSDSIPQNALTLMYAIDGGKYSRPAVINRAETWSVQSHTTGSDYVIAGDTVAVYGRNLSNALVYPYITSSPDLKCMIWLYNSELGSGQYATCTSINPYCAQFTMPAMWATTTSVSSVTFGTGDKNFTVASGLGYVAGLALTAWNSTGYMLGTVKTYNGATGALVMTVATVEDGTSGTVASWMIEPTYDVSVSIHNGHGGAYGWSRAVTLHVSNKQALGINYDKNAAEAMPAPTGTDDSANFTTAKNNIGNNGPGCIQFQQGTYRFSSRLTATLGFSKGVQLKGHASGTTIIPTTSFAPTSGEFISSSSASELNNLTIDTSSYAAGTITAATNVASGSITGATNATPISITATAHGISTGMSVTISGVLGNTAANGNWVITSTGLNTFTLDTSVGNGVYTSGGTYRPWIKVTTGAVNDVATGDNIRIYGVLGNTAANGQWVAAVIDTTHFSLNGSLSNGAYTSGGSWAHETTIRMQRMVDCTISVRAPSYLASNVAGSTFMTNCTVTAPYLFLRNQTSVYIDGSDFYGTDSSTGAVDQIVSVWGGRNFTFTNNTGQDLNSAGGASTRCHGRFLAIAMNNYGTFRNAYIAGNSTPTRIANPVASGDGDAEIIILGEGAQCSSSSACVSATSTTVTITDTASSSWIDTRNAAITGGPGEGQSRRITGVSGNQLTVDPPWDLTPDSTSKINIVGTVHNVVIYGNTFIGGNILSDGSEQGDSQGWNVFAGGSNIIVDGNSLTDMNYGYSEWAVGTTASLTLGICPLFFNLVCNNTFDHCNYAVRTVVDVALNSETAAMLGNIGRNNSATSTVVEAWHIQTVLSNTDVNAFQDCTFTGEKYGVKALNSQTLTHVFWDTVFTGSGAVGSVAQTNVTISYPLGTTAFNSFLA